MSLPTHATDAANLSIEQMVYNRVFVLNATSESNTAILNGYIVEMMNELDVCFQISTAQGTIPQNMALVWDENNYSVLQRTIVADLVAVYVLLIIAAGGDIVNGPGNIVPNPALTTYLKEAKADTAEAQFQQFDLRMDTGSPYLGAQALIDQYKKSAIRKARQLGCAIDISEDSVIAIELMEKLPVIIPFITIGNCGCNRPNNSGFDWM